MPSGSMVMGRGTAGERWTEPTKWIPVIFVLANIVSLYAIYMHYHLTPMIQDGAPRGQAFWLVFHLVTALMLLCYVRCILEHPGTVPSSEADPTWSYHPPENVALVESAGPRFVQTKGSDGQRRHCKWCAKYKPDRCHHCRVCRTCVLRMDHHCPWIYNCVGFKNHKYFFLLLFYAVIDCQLITWTMLGTVRESMDVDIHFSQVFVLLFGETLAAFLALLVTAFFSFHVWLMFRAMTTIEFCEKKTGYNRGAEGVPAPQGAGFGNSVFDRGVYGNLCAVLGDQPLLWLLPVSPPSGDGMRFHQAPENMRLMSDMGPTKGGRDGKLPQQRPSRRPHLNAGTGSAPASGQLSYAAESDIESNQGSQGILSNYGSSRMLR